MFKNYLRRQADYVLIRLSFEDVERYLNDVILCLQLNAFYEQATNQMLKFFAAGYKEHDV